MAERGQSGTPDPNAFMLHSVLSREITAGNKNITKLVSDRKGALYVKKSRGPGQQDNDALQTRLAGEYAKAGFGGNDRTVSLRTFPEQAEFAATAEEAGVPVKVPVFADEQTLIYPYTPGKKLRDLVLFDRDTTGVRPALEVLYKAHDNDIALGNRWAENMIVQDAAAVVPIGLDVAIDGPKAAEFDMAQLLYSTASVTNRNFTQMMEIFSKFSSEKADSYDWQTVVYFMYGYDDYRKTTHKELMPRLGDKLDRVASSLGVE
jgi:tRNA A-37 threonylcarbamoyl transferase component Bud32